MRDKDTIEIRRWLARINNLLLPLKAATVELSLYLLKDGTRDLTGPWSITQQIKFHADSLKALFGAGDDASVYYDGTYMVVKTNEVAASDLKLVTGAAKTLLLDSVVYDDLQVSISNVRVPPANAPTERFYNFGIGGGVTFPTLGFDVGDYLYFDIQSSHAMKLSTVLSNHFHFTLPNTTNIGDKAQFQLDVIAAGINGQWAVPTGSPFTTEITVAANDNTYHRIKEVADIPAVNTTVSTLYKCKLTRIAATASEYGSEVYVNFIDCHYQKDTVGSRQQTSK